MERVGAQIILKEKDFPWNGFSVSAAVDWVDRPVALFLIRNQDFLLLPVGRKETYPPNFSQR